MIKPFIQVLLITLLSLSLSSNATSDDDSFISVDPLTRFFVDAYQRVRIFHGVNVVYKVHPYHPQIEGFHPDLSFSEIDMDNLRRWGFNVVRLGVLWAGLEPVRGEYNETFFEVITTIVDRLAERGIYTMIDAHQDLYSRRFCGDGFPDWSVRLSDDVAPFAVPVGPPLPTDPTGVPPLEICLASPLFAAYYFSEAVSNAFQNFYDNVDNIREHFENFWGFIASEFSHNTKILGYDLLNEPWAGDIYRYPELLLPGVATQRHLVPLYQRLHEVIRFSAPNHILFFHPTTIIDTFTSGFIEGPGGRFWNNKQALSINLYCLDNNTFIPSELTTFFDDLISNIPQQPGFPIESFCDFVLPMLLQLRRLDSLKIGVGRFITEFGAVNGTEEGIRTIQTVTSLADAGLESWAYWQFKYFNDIATTGGRDQGFYDAEGNLQVEKVRALSRTYAQAISGIPTSMVFDPPTGFFRLEFFANPAIRLPTIIYLNEEFYYPSGFNVVVSPPNALTWVQREPNYLKFTNNLLQPQQVTITITPTLN